ncbi:MAG: CotH kinase family protein [Rikenellaceae bacterium]|nr:CotH kinase family protein [Rikenellaceae bacterium]
MRVMTFAAAAACMAMLVAGCKKDRTDKTDKNDGNDKRLVSIEIADNPDKMSYLPDEDFDMTGLVVKNVYSDNSRERTTDYNTVIGDVPESGTVAVTVVSTIDNSKTAGFEFSVSNPDVRGGLPTLYINTQNGAPITSKDTYIKMDLKLASNISANCLEKTGLKDEIRGRGNSTWGNPKKPYRIKFNKKTSLFGLEEAKSWVLLADWRSPTFLQNAIAFELGRRFGVPFTNHFQHVNLVLNGQYEGLYILTEQVQVGKGRVDIDENAGFLAELDFYYDEEPKFTTGGYGLPIMIKSPELNGVGSDAGYAFVRDALNALETAMRSSSFPNSGYPDLIDVDNLVDFLMINDILMNFELQMPASVYMYKNVGEKIKMGPLWDFDCGYGYEEDNSTFFNEYDGRVGKFRRRDNAGTGQAFFLRFFDDPAFVARYKARWNAKYADIQTIPAFIDARYDELNKSMALNGQRWTGKANYAIEISRMKTWWGRRITYLNMEINR